MKAKKSKSTGKSGGKVRKVVLLQGGNPQIAKGDGNAPVQSYIEAMPGWKRAIGERIDHLAETAVPGVEKAVRWNSPFYGTEEHGWFLSFHVYSRYVKVTFFAGLALEPVPPGGTPKSGNSRWVNIEEGEFDEERMVSWIRQAAGQPGWKFQSKTADSEPRKPRNAKVDRLLKEVEQWREEMVKLREIVLDCGLNEELKWGKPCYTLEGHNVVLIQGFKNFCALLFGKGSLLKDSSGILEKPGVNTQAARRIRFTNVEEITEKEAILKSYVREAMNLETSGSRPDFKKEPEPIPEELQKKLEEDPALKSAFESLTPGRQRGYILHISGAKQSETRTRRIEKLAPRILEGKGMHDR